MIWLGLYYWMRLFDSTAFYVTMLRETLMDAGIFLTLLILALCAFGTSAYILVAKADAIKEDPDSRVVAQAFGSQLLDSLLTQYMLGLGEF